MLLLDALVDLALPTRCAGCDVLGTPLCPACVDDLRARGVHHAAAVEPDPVPDGFPATWATTSYDDPLRRVITQHKDGGRVDLGPALAALWRDAAAAALAEDPVLQQSRHEGRPVLVVPAPSSSAARRRRGRDAWRDVMRVALADSPGLVLASPLRVVRRVADQSGLDAEQRWSNLSGAFAVAPGADLSGAACLLSDDVLTTGATLAHSCRALYDAGAHHVSAAVLAATRRRSG